MDKLIPTVAFGGILITLLMAIVGLLLGSIPVLKAGLIFIVVALTIEVTVILINIWTTD